VDETLLARARDGDEDAFAALFERHAGALTGRIRHGLPARLTRKVSVADVLQEVRITAYERLADFEPRTEGAVRAWLLRIAEHKIGNVLKRYLGAAKRAARAEVTRGQRPDTVNARGREPSPSQVAMAGEKARLVREKLALLPEAYRTVLELVFEEQLSLREAAERMGRSRDAAKKLYGRALARFTELVREGEGTGDA
jgi:RNA polymerase sigma-70 factor (ECF subfamily)